MTIVVGYLPRRDGLAALEAAALEAVRTTDRLVVVSAVGTPPSVPVDARDVYAVCRTIGVGAEGVEIEWVRPGRTAAQGILDAVDAHDARLAVVGLRHGRNASGRGASSTAETVLAWAGCAVLVVRDLRS